MEGGRLGERGCVSLGVGQWERGLDAHNLHEADRILKEAEPKMRAARMAYKAKPACTARIRPPDRDRVPSGAARERAAWRRALFAVPQAVARGWALPSTRAVLSTARVPYSAQIVPWAVDAALRRPAGVDAHDQM